MSNFQRVHDDGIVWDGNIGTLVVKYESSSPTVTGLGLRIHFDSSSMMLTSNAANTHGALLIGPNEMGDLDNSDNDDATDSIVNVAWTAFGGNWPGGTNVDLITLTFEKVDGGSNFNHAYTSSSNADGYEFIADPGLPAVPLSLEITPVDENSGVDQVVAVASGGPSGATYSLVDKTQYDAAAEEPEWLLSAVD